MHRSFSLLHSYNKLLAQKNGQYQNSSAQAASSVYVSSGCSYTFTRDLTVGSSGSDVKKLQEFLNSDSSTLVAISGAGSKNQETNYFGPATKSAVAKFQNKYASEVLAPYGLTSGTGYFGPSTRSKANQVCSAQTVSSTSQQQQVEIPVQQSQNYNQNFVASGATLAVNSTQQPRNGIAVENAQRVPYTNIVLTAGSDDVLVEGIRVQLQGVTERDNFSGIAVITSSGAQIGTDRGLRSDNSVVVGGRFTVQRGTSATLIIVGNVADSTDSGASISGVGYLQVTEVLANKAVTGNFPISGAQHTFSDALTLGEVTVSGGSDSANGNVDIGDDNFEFAEYTVALRSNGDEDAYLRSITFEQNGSASSDDLKDVSVRVDSRNSYKPAVNGDRYTVVFPGDGISIEEGDNVDISIEGTIISGYNRNIKFDIDDVSDIYIVGASRGYGLPVTASGLITGRTFDVQAGEGDSSDADFISKSDKNIRAENDQIIGAFELEVESEEIDIDDTTFTLTVENTTNEGLFGFDGTSNEFSQIEISDIKIVDFNTGKVFAEADDYETLSPTSDSAVDAGPKELSIEFNSLYTLPVGETNIVITADLDKEFANATKFKISTWDWGNVEGVITGEDLKSKLGVLEDSKFGEFSIDGDEVTISADSSIESREIVAGSNGVEFIVVEFDASQSKEDVEFEEVFVTVTLGNNANIEHLSNCILTDDDGDEIGEYSNGNDELSGTDSFQFNIDDNLEVKAGEIAEVSVRCDVDKDADEITDGTYIFAISSTDSVDYEIDGDSESVIPDGKDSPSVTIKSFGELDESTVVESDKNWAVGNSDLTVLVGKFEVAAQREGFTVDKITLTVDVTNGDEEDSVERVEIKYDGKTATEEITSSGTSGTQLVFEDLNWNISDQVNKEVAEISLVLNTIGHGDASGRNITTTINSYEAEGDDSGNEPDKSGQNLALGKVNTYKSLPVFSC